MHCWLPWWCRGEDGEESSEICESGEGKGLACSATASLNEQLSLTGAVVVDDDRVAR